MNLVNVFDLNWCSKRTGSQMHKTSDPQMTVVPYVHVLHIMPYITCLLCFRVKHISYFSSMISKLLEQMKNYICVFHFNK